MDKKNAYVGKIGNGGNQIVEAPIKPVKKDGKKIVKTGNDLRTGK